MCVCVAHILSSWGQVGQHSVGWPSCPHRPPDSLLTIVHAVCKAASQCIVAALIPSPGRSVEGRDTAGLPRDTAGLPDRFPCSSSWLCAKKQVAPNSQPAGLKKLQTDKHKWRDSFTDWQLPLCGPRSVSFYRYIYCLSGVTTLCLTVGTFWFS